MDKLRTFLECSLIAGLAIGAVVIFEVVFDTAESRHYESVKYEKFEDCIEAEQETDCSQYY